MTRVLRSGVLLVLLIIAACGDDDSATPSRLPPHEQADIAAIFDPLVEELGFTTTRASLIDRTTYERRPDGTHLALYFAPQTDFKSRDFLEGYMALNRLLIPYAFATWPDLASLDICQEPFEFQGPGASPAVSLIDLDRTVSEGIDWATVSLRRLSDDPGVTVWFNRDILETQAYERALQGE